MARDPSKPVEKTGLREIAWFAALWAGGVAAVTALGAVIKLALGS